MKKSIIAALWLLPFVLYSQTENLLYDQLMKPQDAVYYHVPVGLCEDYPEEKTTSEIIRADFEFLKKHDVKLLRISFGWDAIEEKKDNYNWLFWDEFVKTAVEEYQITLIPYICYTPQWISKGKTDTLFFWNYPAEDFNQFGKFMKTLVTRYKKWIKTWELWNEPDISIYWQGSVEEFAEFTKIGAKAVKDADPEAKVVCAGIAYDPNFTLKLFRDYGVSPYVDIINMHNYYETWHRHPVESIVEYINEVYDVVWRYGNNQSLWMAEVGYSTFRKGSYVSSSYQAYYDYEHTPEYQAIDLIKRLTLAVSTEKLAAIAWYEIKDLPKTDEVIGDEYNNRYLGVAYPDHKPKPAAQALQFFNQLFSEKYRCIDRNLTIDKKLGSDSEVHAFETRSGDVILVGWIKTVVPGDRSQDKSGMVKDNRSEKVSLKIPLTLSGKVTQFNEQGESHEFSGYRRENNQIIINDLHLRGGDVTILRFQKD
jgi:hypothetical protein